MNTEGDLTNLISTAQQPQPQQPPQQPQQRQQQQSVQQDETTDSTSTGLPPEHISSTTAPPSSPPKDVTAVSASCTRQYAMLRASKKFRPPISIFDLPCQPASAPPQDTESFFAHLDTVEKTLEEEDAGQIPKALETGPQIVVESLNKKRRRVPTTSEQPLEISTEIIPEPPPAEALDDKLTPQGFLSNPLPFSQSSSSSASMGITSESPSISSSSSGSLSFTGDTAATTTTDDMNDSMPKDKKVRFSQDPAEIHLIKNWRRRASKRKERHFIRHSAIVKHPNALQGISTTDTSDTNTMPPRGRILSADLPSYEDQQFHEWLAGTSPPPPMPEPVTQQMSGIVAENSQKPSTKKKRFSERLRGPLKTQQEEPLPVEAKGSSSMIDGHESEQISMSKQLASDQDQSQDPNEDTVELEFVPETQEEASMDPEGTSKEIASEKNTSTSIPQTNTIITRIPGPSMPTIFNTKKHNDILDKGDESASATTLKPNNMTVDAIGELIQVDSDLEEKSVNLDGIIENTSSSTNTALDLQAITASSKGKAKKDKEPVKTVAAMIRPRRKLVAPSKSSHIVEPQSEKPSSNMSSDVAAGKKHAPLARTISLISIEDDDDDTKVADIDKAPTPPMPQTNMASKPGSTARQTQASVKKGKKPATTESPALPSSSKAKTIALSELSLYVIPNNMDTAIFNITRKRVIELHGKWLGPAFKVLSTDPRAKAEIPPLDQENTTHIVTAFTSVEEVKRFFNVTTINVT
ncbi:hypothetical protein BCR41DRAFT_148020 [Lobosporangium transversale]|uniref:Uncharacterized protein n=1 Tax=Lobosporangium transversale TaxID=64571 RepID=A0A1Y2GDK9_9FUNG|nr:hypothetical protein BCR41DRAFT_148020 [Lobosporangium transversale]ORZ07942.1 hypothetical protein BCR41DRAFT_148020 [Lobosporangium transversale]|eukprot:XP_021878176.1 hypothetical protein BCR41DRAFT_148020 [Lobosporangium transversale]